MTPLFPSSEMMLHAMTLAAGKAAAALLIALLCMACLRRGSAAVRHLILALAVAVALLLPIAATLTPVWRLAVLPANPAAPILPVTPAVVTSQPRSAPAPLQNFHEMPAAVAASSPLPAPTVATPQIAQPARRDASTWILLTWIIGTGLTMTGWAIGAVAAYRLAGSAPLICDGPITGVVAALRFELDIRRQISLRIGGKIHMPLTAGLFRPVLLLPSEAIDWSEQKLRAVVLHELAHVKRRDCATQLLGQIVCAVYWFNPLAWMVTARLRVERERACDDAVLRHGADPVSYADLLLAVAKTLRGRRLADVSVVAMARRSGLRDRVTQILSAAVNRSAVSRYTVIASMLIALVALLPLAAVRLANRPVSLRAAAVTSTTLSTQPIVDSTASPETDRLVIVPSTGETKPGELTDSGGFPLLGGDRFRAPDALWKPGPWFFLFNSDGSEALQIEVLKLGVPANAPIEEIVKRTVTGDIYQPKLGTIQPVRGSLMAPLDMPADNRWVVEDIKFHDFIRTMTREQIARKVLAYHHAHPETTSWQVKEGQTFAILRPNGGISCMAVRGPGTNKCADDYVVFVPIGSVKLATTQPATQSVKETIKQQPGKVIQMFVHDNKVQLRQNNTAIEADQIEIHPTGGISYIVDVYNGMVRVKSDNGNIVAGNRIEIGTSGQITGEGGVVTVLQNAFQSATAPALAPPAGDATEPGATGRLIDIHGQPIVGAILQSLKAKNKTISDSSGKFKVPALASGIDWVKIRADGFATRTFSDDEMKSGKAPIELHRVARLQGRVLGIDGKPIVGTEISVDVHESYGTDSVYLVNTASISRATTGTNGEFTLSDVPPGKLVLACWDPAKANGGRAPSTAMELSATDGQAISNLVLDLSKATGIAVGRVVDSNSKPLAGISVRLAAEWMFGMPEHAEVSSTTDTDGRYRLRGLPTGNWHLCGNIGETYRTVAIALSSEPRIAPDLVLPVMQAPSGRIRRVSPMNAKETVQEWLDATRAGAVDAESAAAVIAPASPIANSGSRVLLLVPQISKLTSWSESTNGTATVSTNEIDLDGSHTELRFKLAGTFDHWLIADVTNGQGVSLLSEEPTTQPALADLNADQKLVLAWTDDQFRSFFDARTFAGWSGAEKTNLETRSINALKGPQDRDYFQAINTLAALKSTKALPDLRQIAFDRRDKNNRDRWMAIRAIGIIGDKSAVPELIHLVYHGNSNTHWWAQISLVRLTGQNFGSDWNAWGKWWNGTGGQPAFDPTIIRWYSEQPEPDKLAKQLQDSDEKFLAGFRK